MIFFATVVVPVLRRDDMKAVAPRLLRVLGPRFRALGWASLGVLVLTGISNLYLRGIGVRVLCDALFWASPFGHALAWKLGFVGITITVTATHDIVTRKRELDVMERSPSSAEAQRARRVASWVGRGIMVSSLFILYFAVALVRGIF